MKTVALISLVLLPSLTGFGQYRPSVFSDTLLFTAKGDCAYKSKPYEYHLWGYYLKGKRIGIWTLEVENDSGLIQLEATMHYKRGKIETSYLHDQLTFKRSKFAKAHKQGNTCFSIGKRGQLKNRQSKKDWRYQICYYADGDIQFEGPLICIKQAGGCDAGCFFYERNGVWIFYDEGRAIKEIIKYENGIILERYR